MTRDELINAIDSPIVQALARVFNTPPQRMDKSFSEQIVEILAPKLINVRAQSPLRRALEKARDYVELDARNKKYPLAIETLVEIDAALALDATELMSALEIEEASDPDRGSIGEGVAMALSSTSSATAQSPLRNAVIEECAEASEEIAKRFRFSYGADTTQSSAINLVTAAIRSRAATSAAGPATTPTSPRCHQCQRHRNDQMRTLRCHRADSSQRSCPTNADPGRKAGEVQG